MSPGEPTNGPSAGGARAPSAWGTREAQMLSRLQGLLVLSMRMSEGADQPGIVNLAVSTVPSLLHGRVEGVFLTEGGWQRHTGDTDMLRAADLEAQFAVLSSAGGPLAVQGRP